MKKDRENRREKLVTREGYRNGVKVAGRGEHLGGMFGAQPCEVRNFGSFDFDNRVAPILPGHRSELRRLEATDRRIYISGHFVQMS